MGEHSEQEMAAAATVSGHPFPVLLDKHSNFISLSIQGQSFTSSKPSCGSLRLLQIAQMEGWTTKRTNWEAVTKSHRKGKEEPQKAPTTLRLTLVGV